MKFRSFEFIFRCSVLTNPSRVASGDDDDQVLEAALSLLDECEGGDADTTGVRTTTKKKRNYNPNRAREAQRTELLALRKQVPQLEKRLKMLHQEMENINLGAMAVGRPETMELWRKMVIYQRQTRMDAEEENKRLRELLREHNDVTNRNIQHLLQTKQGRVEVRVATIFFRSGVLLRLVLTASL